MKKKNFPSKENFFGIKRSPIIKTIDSTQKSPIYNYFQCLSPTIANLNNKTPKEDYSNIHINNLNNFSLNENNISNEEDYGTLQDRINIFNRTNDSNNFKKKTSISGNTNQEGKKNDSQSEEENEEEFLTFSINNLDDDAQSKSNTSGNNHNLEKNPNNSIKGVSIKSIINNQQFKPYIPNQNINTSSITGISNIFNGYYYSFCMWL